jgi:hypothetical protein
MLHRSPENAKETVVLGLAPDAWTCTKSEPVPIMAVVATLSSAPPAKNRPNYSSILQRLRELQRGIDYAAISWAEIDCHAAKAGAGRRMKTRPDAEARRLYEAAKRQRQPNDLI